MKAEEEEDEWDASGGVVLVEDTEIQRIIAP